VKVLLVDDSVAIQKSFGALLQAVPSVDVVGYAEDVVSALAATWSGCPAWRSFPPQRTWMATL